ncbi:ATP-binding protein [Motiliproteus sp. SC1-56]|uniref:sensor histidine kinase n=1 Tax=Motiliproteus sp. SC1-56 TaxID=2799565 RepID=UPI001A900D7C|nr:ATP-binding protein [Motiliproteus sp. SC1-56]
MQRLFTRFRQHTRQNRLSYRLLLYIVLCSTLLAVVSTGAQLFWDYRKDVRSIEKGIDSIEAGYLDSLASSLWKLDKDQITIQLDGIVKLPDIEYASITEIVAGKEEAVFLRGDPETTYPITEAFDLYYRETLVGRLAVGATLENVYERLLQRFLVILGSQAIKTFLVSICILVIVHLLVVRHLNGLSRYTQRLDLDNLDEALTLEGRPQDTEAPDAIDQLVETLNLMRNNIRSQLAAKKQAQQALEDLNEELEQRVKYRTATLKHTNERLSSVIEELKSTKDRLVESEKMAALGELVAGVAHELNTPVGNGITMASHLSDNIEALESALALPRSADSAQLQEITEEIREASELIHSNLEHTAELVNTFKQITTDQGGEVSERFKVCDALSQATGAFGQEMSERGCTLSLECEPALALVSYPNSLQLVLRNLISNSLVHGFERRGGHIRIAATRESEQLKIVYEDDGEGIPEPIRHRIFDPFVTTKRSQGSTGLGTHIIYNLVNNQLGGSIECESERGQGTRFTLRLPLALHAEVDDSDDDLW